MDFRQLAAYWRAASVPDDRAEDMPEVRDWAWTGA